MRRGLVVVVVLLVAFAPVLAAPPDEPLKTIAGRMVTQFRVGRRPPASCKTPGSTPSSSS